MNLKDKFKKETGQSHETSATFCKCDIRVDIWNDLYIKWLEEKLKKYE
tara:strand:+ start:332 stop:475 length:144 start_codon:yes stop_codon:yes gene_type:complete